MRSIFIALFLFLALSLLFISDTDSALDNPHNIYKTVNCADCHVSNPPAEWWTDQGGGSGICYSCHNGAPTVLAKTHSSATTSTKYGTWDKKCTDCHDPHYQRQNRTYKSLSYLYSGVSTAVTTTTIKKTGAGWTTDQWAGMILLPDVRYLLMNHRILSNTADTITIDTGNGDTINQSYITPGSTFAVVYGRLAREYVESSTVRFFRQTGTNSFADGDATMDGVCEVCHTKTSHFRKNGTGPDQLHTNVNSPVGAKGTNCTEACHKHDNGFEHGGSGGGSGCGDATSCHGIRGSHPTHINNAGGRGLALACSECHNTSNFPQFKDSQNLAETTACDNCHSPGGSYDGVNDAVIGAKNNWDNSVYDENSLKNGKEKWCAGCHDGNSSVAGQEPSLISGVYAPPVIGDESSAYTYGTGWGYYKTGHGLPGAQTYPASGGVTTGANVQCSGCHDFSAVHIDGFARTFNDGNSSTIDPSYYRQGYRLKLVGGQEPMQVPWKKDNVNFPNAAARYRLCASCHDTGPFTDPNNWNTNLVTAIDNNPANNVNRHVYHLEDQNLHWSADWDPGYDGAGATSRITCVVCHNVHGSTQLAMVRDGKLTGRDPGLKIWYYDDSTVVNESNNQPPDPENTPLAASDGTIWRGGTSGNLCSHCHSNDNTVKKSRTPYQDVSQSPTFDWTGENGYVTDGVDPDSAKAKSYFEFRIKYTDKNNEPPSPIQVWVDVNDNGTYEPGEMHTMAEANPSDINYTDGKIYTFAMQISKFSDNTFDYRFFASDGVLNVEFPSTPDPDKTVTVTNSSPVLSWTGETYYETDGVSPNIGGNGAGFTFKVLYQDSDGECPDVDGVKVIVDGTSYDLNNNNGASCTDGRIYYRTITLSTAGDLNYHFVAKDSAGSSATGEATSDHVVTVLSTFNTPPSLDWVVEGCYTNGVKPVKGLATGDFTFKVKYTDIDNQCPPAASDIQVVVNEASYDLNQNDGAACNTGRTYYRTIQLGSAGALNYYFTANDGTDTATGDPTITSGKQVTVVSTANAVGVRTGTGDTAPWYNSIQAATNLNTPNLSILVYEGTYNENVRLDNSPDTDEGIVMESVCGAELTTISASSGDTVFVQNISTSATIDGFTITGGSNGIGLNNSPLTVKNCIIRNNNRGINSSNTSNRLTVENTIIRNNTGNVSGAGIYINGGSGHSITGSTIKDNTANYNSLVLGSGSAGGMLVQSGASGLTITDTTISGNYSDLSGGGIFLNNSSMTLTGTVVKGNTSNTSGGGIFLQGTGSSSLTNCNVVDNIANSAGGGFNLVNYTTNITNCTVSNNSLTDTTNGLGGGMYANNPTVFIKNSIFWANKAAGKGSGHECFVNNGSPVTFIYSDVPNNLNALAVSGVGSYSIDSTNIEADPLFADNVNGDYHLKEISPAIDQGTAAGAPADDIDGGSRPQPVGGDYDMGSDEYSTEGQESEPPVVTGFTATTPSNNRNVPITLFTATDNVGVTGYVINTSAVPPSIGSGGWSGTPPSTYLVPSDGTHTVYPWVRDAAGNVSTIFGSPQTVVVDATAPTVTVFTATTPTNTLNIPITAFTATDTVGVTGYQITVSSTPPSAGGGGWSGTAPTTYTVGSAGTYTLYPWAKDALGNVSAVFGTPRTVVVDLTPPQVSSTTPYDTQTNVMPNNNVTINWDEGIDCSTVTASTVTISPQPGAWAQTFCSGSQAVFSPDSQSQLTTYTVTVTISVKDVAGNSMASDYQFSYETSGGTNTSPVLSWTSENCLIDGVKPRAGKSGDTFEFKVNYTDDENQCPASGSNSIQVLVDLDGDGYEAGEKYNLTEVSAGDTDCTPAGGGKLYSTTRTLNSTGDLNYRFYASDGIDDATGAPTSDSVVRLLSALIVRPSGSSLPYDYTSIQTALNASSSGSNIIVYPNDDFTAATYSSISDTSTTKPNRELLSACGADLTVISGGGYAINFQDSDNIVVDGFSITGATTAGVRWLRSNNSIVRNSKIYGNPTGVTNNAESITVRGCLVYNNTTRGINSENSTGIIHVDGSEVYNNGTADYGGGIRYNGGTTHTITDSYFHNNSASISGGVAYLNATTLNVTNSIFANNQAPKGGVFYLNGSNITINQCTFVSNQATSTTGGVIGLCSGTPVVYNSVFYQNTAAGDGDNGFKECGGSDGWITFYDSMVNTTYPGFIGGKQATVSGNMLSESDPLFTGTYRLQAGSPVIDQANPSYAPDYDIDGDCRSDGNCDAGPETTPDMGADEYVP